MHRPCVLLWRTLTTTVHMGTCLHGQLVAEPAERQVVTDISGVGNLHNQTR